MIPKQRAQLVKLLGMLGSDFAGERATAAEMACKLLKQMDITWDDVVIQCGVAAQSQKPQVRPLEEWQEHAFRLLRLPNLTRWEITFLQSISVQRYSPTPRQCYYINKIGQRS